MMGFNSPRIRDKVIECFVEFIGDTSPLAITEKANPIRDFGKDSMDGVDFACMLSEKFNIHVPDEINPFVDDNLKQPRTLADIINLVCGLLSKKEEATHV